MRDQYAGDISDLLKLAFLRALADDDKTLGVGWYYNPDHDGRSQDGRHREFCDEEHWRAADSVVFDALVALRERSVTALEELPIWPAKTRFHRIPIPPGGERRAWAIEMKAALQEASIVFLDPDNGIGNRSPRHTTPEEVGSMRQPERAVTLIKFPRRQNHETQIKAYHELLAQTGATSIVTVRTCVSVVIENKNGRRQKVPRFRWFTIVDADEPLTRRAEQFAQTLNSIENCKAVAHVFGG